MEHDALQQTWRSQNSQQTTVDVESLLSLVKRNHCDFRSRIVARDVTEIGTALFLTVLFATYGEFSAVWSWLVLAAGCLFVAVFMLVDRHRQKRMSASRSETLAEWLEKSRLDIEHQIWLLRNVFWWYLLPPLVGMTAVFVHRVWLEPGTGPALFIVTATFSGAIAIVGIVFYGVYLLNQRAVREELRPRLEELQSLAESLNRDPRD